MLDAIVNKLVVMTNPSDTSFIFTYHFKVIIPFIYEKIIITLTVFKTIIQIYIFISYLIKLHD